MGKILVVQLLVVATLLGCRARQSVSTVASADGESCSGKQQEVKAYNTTPISRSLDPIDSNREAVLVYYAIDTKEPYFQATVHYELTKLQSVCKDQASQSKINWVVFLNSHYNRREPSVFLLCRAGHLSTERYDQHPKLKSKLDRLRGFIAGVDVSHYEDEVDVITPLPKDQEFAKILSDAPLSHPQALVNVMSYVHDALFPRDRYVSFLHLKSHGSTGLMLTGLSDQQLSNKTECQNKLLAHKSDPSHPISKTPVTPLFDSTAFYGQAGFMSTPDVEKTVILARLGATGIGSGLGTENDDRLGTNNSDEGLNTNNDENLHTNNDENLGIRNETAREMLSVSAAGLGVESGLGISQGIGTNINDLLAVARNIQLNTAKKGPIGFVLAESCESNTKKQIGIADYLRSNRDIMAYYSAVGSLWFRNIDWDTFLNDWAASGGGAQNFQTRMIKATKKIPNFIYRDRPVQ